jgi:hypothetical protein
VPARSRGQRCVPVCGVVDDELPEVVLPGVVVVLGWPPPGALAELGPMPAAALVLDELVPAGVPVVPVCDELLVSAAGAPDDEVPLVLVLLLPEVVLELLPVLAASPPVVLAVDEVPVPVSAVVSLVRWQAPNAAAAASEIKRLRAMDEVGVMSAP